MSELIKLNDIFVSYQNIPALVDCSLTINEGDFLGIIGPNGGGKSTLMKSILGLVQVQKGEILYKGTKRRKANIRMGYVPQMSEFNRQFPITVFEVVLMRKLKSEITPFFRYSKKDELEVLEVLEKVGILELRNRQISELSGGEAQKMLVARALAIHPEILLLDEPTAMVDIQAQKQIFHLLKRLSKEMTVVLITHQSQSLLKQLTRLVYINKNVIAEGDPIEVYQYFFGMNRRNKRMEEGEDA